MLLFAGANMQFALTSGCLYFTLYLTISAETFTCPTQFNWYPDAYDCSKFYRCVWGKGHSFTCPQGTLWSQDILTCDFEHHVSCSKKRMRQDSQDILRDNSQKSPNFSVDNEEDAQPLKESSKREEDTVIHSPIEGESERGDDLNTLRRVEDSPIEGESERGDDLNTLRRVEDKSNVAYFQDVNQYEDNHEHNRYSSENLQSNSETFDDDTSDFNDDQSKNTLAAHMNNSNNIEEDDDFISDDDLDYFVEDAHHNDDLDIEYDYQNKKVNIFSKKRPVSQLLGAHVLSTYQITENPKSHIHHENTKPAATSIYPKPRSDTFIDSSAEDLYTKYILTKLLQLQRYREHIKKHRDLVNTDGTYDILDMSLFPEQNNHNGYYEPYIMKIVKSIEPWSSSDFFRAGYGYKRIYHKM